MPICVWRWVFSAADGNGPWFVFVCDSGFGAGHCCDGSGVSWTMNKARDGGNTRRCGRSREAAVHNVREGRSPAELEEQLGAHPSTRQQGDGIWGRARARTRRLSDRARGPGAEAGQQVLVGDKGLGPRR